MSGAAIVQPGRVGPHIYVYLGLALLVFNFIWIVVAARGFRGETNPTNMLIEVVSGIAIANVLFWFARRRCSSPSMSGWRGLVLMTTYMTIGVGSYSVFVAVPAVLIGIVASIAISLASLFSGERDFSPRHYHRLVHFYYRNRMHQ